MREAVKRGLLALCLLCGLGSPAHAASDWVETTATTMTGAGIATAISNCGAHGCTVNLVLCNPSASSLTPANSSISWQVLR